MEPASQLENSWSQSWAGFFTQETYSLLAKVPVTLNSILNFFNNSKRNLAPLWSNSSRLTFMVDRASTRLLLVTIMVDRASTCCEPLSWIVVQNVWMVLWLYRINFNTINLKSRHFFWLHKFWVGNLCSMMVTIMIDLILWSDARAYSRYYVNLSRPKWVLLSRFCLRLLQGTMMQILEFLVEHIND